MLFKWPILALSAALVAVAGGSLAYISHERTKESQMAASNDSLLNSVATMQQQVQALNQKIADLSAPKPEPAAPPRLAVRKTRTSVRTASRSRRPLRDDTRAGDPRIQQMQAQLADEQKQIAGTREDLDKARAELSGRLDSTRGELTTSIAKNHDELVELEKRGQRSYDEFQLDKSKNFDRVGPIRLSLRKADVKHKSFNVAMMVDDNQLQKKNVNLYEPVWINADGESLELVVNQITKNHIQGYLSEPKYKQTDARASTLSPAQPQPALQQPAPQQPVQQPVQQAVQPIEQ